MNHTKPFHSPCGMAWSCTPHPLLANTGHRHPYWRALLIQNVNMAPTLLKVLKEYLFLPCVKSIYSNNPDIKHIYITYFNPLKQCSCLKQYQLKHFCKGKKIILLKVSAYRSEEKLLKQYNLLLQLKEVHSGRTENFPPTQPQSTPVKDI